MLRVAVLGASGFLGNRAVEMLHLRGLAEVRPVVRNVARLALPSRFDLDFRVADGFDRSALRTAFNGCDVVVHAIAGDLATIQGTLAPVYHAAQDAGVQRLIYLSTASVHGQAPRVGTNEASRLDDKQALAYNNAKVRAERILGKLRKRGSVELVVLRPAIVFGPRSVWVTRFVEAMLAGEAYLINRGEGICNTAYVDNVIRAVHLAMTNPSVDRQVFLIGDQERVTWAKFYQPFVEALGYDMGYVHHVEPSSLSVPSKKGVKAIFVTGGLKKAVSLLPRDAKIALSAMRRLLMKPVRPPSPWETPEESVPQATLEMSLLYQCDYKLPIEKAKTLLNYEPLVSFDEGCRHTISWLAFAGYPVVQS